jgi:gas vesicle protein
VDAPVVDEGESEPEVGRTDLKVIQARKTLEEEAEAARRRVLGPRRGRVGPATLTAPAPTDDDVNMSEHVRELVRTVEAETERLHEDVSRLRSAAGRAGATLQEEIQRAAEELSEETVEQLESAVQQTATESLDALTASVDTLQDTAAALTEVAAGLRTSVEQLVKVAPIAEQLAELAAAPPSIPDALAGILGDLTDQLSDLGDAVATQVRGAVEEGLTTELARHDARIEHALARVVDELARLRRRMPVTKRGAAVDFSKDQLEGIGKAVGDYLLAAMRDQKS